MLIKIDHKSRHEPTKPRYIDLFAGCGGLSLGLHQAGWQGFFAVEKSPDAFATLKHNLIDKKNHFDWPAWLGEPKNHDINVLLRKHKRELEMLRGKVDLVAGGPPCQGFSTAGRRDPNDVRNTLVNSYVRFIKLVQPKFIFFENVRGFTMAFHDNREKSLRYSEIVVKALQRLGYEVHGELINFGEFGLPQKRTRFILVGAQEKSLPNAKEMVDGFFTSLRAASFDFLKSRGLTADTTLADAISDLSRLHGIRTSPDSKGFAHGVYGVVRSNYQRLMRAGVLDACADSHRFANHGADIERRLQYILRHAERNRKVGNDIRSRFNLKKQNIIPLAGNQKAPTITTLPDDYVHYEEARILTVRECARVQGFPDWYFFKGKYTTGGKKRISEVPRYSQIGNAIPPLFSELCGQTLSRLKSFKPKRSPLGKSKQ